MYGILHQLAYSGAGDVYGRLVQKGVAFDLGLLTVAGETAQQIASNRSHAEFAARLE